MTRVTRRVTQMKSIINEVMHMPDKELKYMISRSLQQVAETI